MDDADSTWAIVVGIDAYDHFDPLTGAANDAVAAVKWLRRLGVPDEQIMLHAAPTNASEKAVKDLGIPVGGCKEAEIFESFRRLIKGRRGSKLFVFLSGHGLFEPGGDRVFLTQESCEDVPVNLGVEWYAELLLGLPFKRQIIVMDGCLNLPYSPAKRAEFEGGRHPGVKPRPPRADVLQAVCYGASQGETAQELDGRGMFSANLLAVLDPDRPQVTCIDIDDETGTVQWDLKRAVERVAGPATREQAAELGRVQNPKIEIPSKGPAPSVVPVAEFTRSDAVRLTVSIGPDTALPDVTRVALWSEQTDWRRVLENTIPPVYERHLPPNLVVTARCTVRPGSEWIQPGPEDRHTDEDQEIEFDLKTGPSGPSDARTVYVVDMDDRIAPRITDRGQRLVEEALDDFGGGVDFEFDRGGVRFEIEDAPEQASRAASDIARLIDIDTGARFKTAVDVVGAALQRPEAIEVRVTAHQARRLAGLHADDLVVMVGDQRRTPLELVDVPWVPAEGPTRVSVELPWGTWITRVAPSQGEDAVVELPRKVGVPPLRTTLLRDPRGHPGHPLTVRTARADISGSPMVDAEGEAIGPELTIEPSPGSAWLGKVHGPSQKVLEPGRWQRFVETHGLRFPLSETGPIALHLGRFPRAEPLSTQDTEAWDQLVAAGRLDDVSGREAQSLAVGKWGELLIGLAGAYACYAQRQDEFLAETLENLRHLDPGLPDLPLLEAGLDQQLGQRREEVGESLCADAVPLFRWGIPIGVLAAHHYDQPELARRLEKIEARLVSSSSWTLWRP